MDGSEFDDETIKAFIAREKNAESLKNGAKVLHDQFTALCDAGFREEYALTIICETMRTAALMRVQFAMAKRGMG